MLSAVARPALRSLRASPRGIRHLHVENTVNNNTPFSYANPKALAFKMIAFCGLGFATPFIASAYQIQKASA
ncbi:hypothetical protein BCR35DRAFT_44574 [Leucosporidium creatinivorum]|uniref:Cytochrome c oxidase subunit 8, mitochondrial n=1 Tax=Leucosporidium creatinivorum TaxID=106004 RepID=A0A1Y2FTR2_9BASI|nr:hypothetical protein BCR35DRAFT_44574 [Leucosporidium creatinivorum]